MKTTTVPKKTLYDVSEAALFLKRCIIHPLLEVILELTLDKKNDDGV